MTINDTKPTKFTNTIWPECSAAVIEAVEYAGASQGSQS